MKIIENYEIKIIMYFKIEINSRWWSKFRQ